MKISHASAKPLCRGFTLIELTVVIAIIAILALMALPSYTEKIVREQIIEAVKLADVAKGPVATAWANSVVPPSTTRTMPADNVAAGLPAPDKIVNNYIRSITVENGALHLQFGNSAHRTIHGKTLTIRPAVVDDAPMVPPSWICAAGKVPDKMAVKGGNNTTIEQRYLPRNCY